MRTGTGFVQHGWKHLAIVTIGVAVLSLICVCGCHREDPAPVVDGDREHRLEDPASVAPTGTPEARATIGAVGEIFRRRTPRSISAEQAEKAVDILRAFPLTQRPLAEPVNVLALAGDQEAAGYAKQLARVLEDGGWATTLATTTVTYKGVMCLVDNAQEFPVHARVLILALQQAGIPCIPANNERPPSNRIEIVVGLPTSD